MTSKLEKQFFDTFDIQYEFCSDSCLNPCKFQCDDCEFSTEVYPQITDRILLELMELLMKQQYNAFYYENEEYLFSSKLLGSNRPTCNKVSNLRELILRTAICLGSFTSLKEKMLDQVQALFKEG